MLALLTFTPLSYGLSVALVFAIGLACGVGLGMAICTTVKDGIDCAMDDFTDDRCLEE